MTIPPTQTALLTSRTALRLGGEDRVSFLQNLISNDVNKVSEKLGIYAALLTPQGKFLYDMFVLAKGENLLIDCEAGRASSLLSRLKSFQLRARITLDLARDEFDIYAAWGREAPLPGLSYADPRLPELGWRTFMSKNDQSSPTLVPFEAYDAHRLMLGVADGDRDMDPEKSTLAEGNFDLLNGIDWKKGCYIGQELTARMHYRGLAKKRFFPVRINGKVPRGAALTYDQEETGLMASSDGQRGLALLPIERARLSLQENRPFMWQNVHIYPFLPPWMTQKG